MFCFQVSNPVLKNIVESNKGIFFPNNNYIDVNIFYFKKRVEIITWFTTTSDKLVKTLL